MCKWALAMLCMKLCKLNQAAQCLFVTGKLTGTAKYCKAFGTSTSTRVPQVVTRVHLAVALALPPSLTLLRALPQELHADMGTLD